MAAEEAAETVAAEGVEADLPGVTKPDKVAPGVFVEGGKEYAGD